VKILHTVEFYHPSTGGMQEVVKQLSERLAEMGHDITVATTSLPERKKSILNGVKIAGFSITGNTVRGLSGETEKYTDFLLNGDFDIITNFAAQQWATDIALPILDQINAKKVFVPTGFSGLYLPEYKNYFEKMRSWMKKYDMNIFLSNSYRDIDLARENGTDNIMIIPNGAGKDEFISNSGINIRQKLNIPDDHFLVLHVGSHTNAKGHSEAIQIFKKAKIRNSTFVIVANSFGGGCTTSCKWNERLFKFSPKQLTSSKSLIVRSLSRKETVAAYKEADLFLFPSNIECSPLVLFECMASKTPFLTTDVGNSAEIIEWSGGGMLLPTTKDSSGNSNADISGSVNILETLYNDPSLRDKIQEKGFNAWEKRFTWEKISKEYEALYKSLLDKT